jgi:hypothetical protein
MTLGQLRAEHGGEWDIVRAGDGKVRAQRRDDPLVQVTRASEAALDTVLRISRGGSQ